MVKDEADVIEATIGRMLIEVDQVIVADNGSTDGTAQLLRGMETQSAGRLLVLDDGEVGYYQSVKMSALARRAADLGAVWVVPFDADEVWSSQWGPVGDVLRALPPNEGIAPATVYDHVTSDLDDQSIADPTRRIEWRRIAPLELPKVAVRPIAHVTIEQGNHGARYFDRCPNPPLRVDHFPYRSDAQFLRKVRNGAAAYAATTLPDHAGAHWRQWGQLLDDIGPDEFLRTVYRTWFHVKNPRTDPIYTHDPLR